MKVLKNGILIVVLLVPVQWFFSWLVFNFTNEIYTMPLQVLEYLKSVRNSITAIGLLIHSSLFISFALIIYKYELALQFLDKKGYLSDSQVQILNDHRAGVRRVLTVLLVINLLVFASW